MSGSNEHHPRWPSWATEAVAVVEYDPTWADRGAHERDHLQQLLAPWLTGDIEHVGSTAVAGLAAKPIIDLQAPVRDLTNVARIAPTLASHGWHDVPPELDQRPHRRFLVKVVSNRRVAHLHLMTAASARWHHQLAFRDALRADPNLLRAYAQLKRSLARMHPTDRDAYTAGKQRFIQDVLSRVT